MNKQKILHLARNSGKKKNVAGKRRWCFNTATVKEAKREQLLQMLMVENY
jgi:hypothetical protein